MDIAWSSLSETISLSGPHGIDWSTFTTEIKRIFNVQVLETDLTKPDSPLNYLFSQYQQLKPDYLIGTYPSGDLFKKNVKTKLMDFEPLQEIQLKSINSSSINTLRFYCSNPTIRHNFIFNGRPLQLSDSSLLALELIASHGRKGVTQAELARLMGCDSKSAFHWLKSLVANDLIVRLPVASKRTFTYLLTLTRFEDEQFQLQDEKEQELSNADSTQIGDLMIPSSVEIRQRIVDALAKAPNRTMVSKDVFLQIGLRQDLIKNFRRSACQLQEIGWLEYLFENQLAGPFCRLFRLKRSPAEGLNVKTFALETKKELKKMEFIPLGPKGADYKHNVPLIQQLILAIAKAFPEGVTTAELCHRFGLSRKYIYRLIDRIIPPSGKAEKFVGGEGVTKVADFIGKEKRIKLFVKDQEWKEKYIKLLRTSDENITINDAEKITNTVQSTVTPSTTINTNMLSIPSRTSTPATSASSSIVGSPSDTRTRQIRHRAILDELQQTPIIEIGKELCYRLQQRIGDSRFTLDVKTVRRSADILERDHLIKTIVTTIPYNNGTVTRTLLIAPELNATDQVVLDYIANLRETFRIGPTPGNVQKPKSEATKRLQEAMSRDDFFVPDSALIPSSSAITPSMAASLNRQALGRFGFIFGILARAKIFHEFLLSNMQFEDASPLPYFETISAVFERLPLQLFIELIGMTRMSQALAASLNQLRECPLNELPVDFKEELVLSRKRFHSQAQILLQTLTQLGLIISVEEHFASLKFKMPFKFRFSAEVPVYNVQTGAVVKLIQFDYKETRAKSASDEFWNYLQSICKSPSFSASSSSRVSSIYDSEEQQQQEEDTAPIAISVPKPFLLARHAESWKSRPGQNRELERSARRLAAEIFSLQRSKKRRVNTAASISETEVETLISSNISRMTTEYEVDADRLEKMLEYFLRELEERDEAKRLNRISSSKKRKITTYDDQDNDDDDQEEDEDFDGQEIESEDIEHLRWNPSDREKLRLAFCLLQQPQFLCESGVRWQLASSIFEKPKDPAIIRRHGIKICRSYSELQKLLELDTIVQLALSRRTDISTVEFKELFDYCASFTEVDDLFSVNDEQSEDIVLTSRKDHFTSVMETWILPRSFRHELMQNDPGIIRDPLSCVRAHSYTDAELLLRKVLIYSTGEFENQFDPEVVSNALSQYDSSAITAAVEALIQLGFASKTKGRNKYRLLGFPVSIAESVRSNLDPDHEEDDNSTLMNDELITNSSDNLSIEKAVRNCLEGNFSVEIVDEPNRIGHFDAPIRLVPQHSANTLESSKPSIDRIASLIYASSSKDFMWISLNRTSPATATATTTVTNANANVLTGLLKNSLNYLKSLIREYPGISIDQLKTRTRAVFTHFEVDALVEILISTDSSVKLLESEFLQ